MAGLARLDTETLLDLKAVAEVAAPARGRPPTSTRRCSPRATASWPASPACPSRSSTRSSSGSAAWPRSCGPPIDDLDQVEGVGDHRAKAIKEGLQPPGRVEHPRPLLLTGSRPDPRARDTTEDDVRITLPGGTPAELARPDSGIEPRPGLVLFPDIMGLRPLFDDHVRPAGRRARLGGVRARAVPRAGGPRRPGPDGRRADAVGRPAAGRRRSPPPTPPAASGSVATGFCMGGMLAFKAAASGRFARAAGFYGMIRLPERMGGRRPGRARRGAGLARALPDDGHRRHRSTPTRRPADVAAAEALGVEVVRYEGADHGFVHDPSRPTHRADDAADAWRRVVAFLSA